MEKLGYTLSGYSSNKKGFIQAGDDLDFLKNMGEKLKKALDNQSLKTPEGTPYDRLEITNKEDVVYWTSKKGESDMQKKSYKTDNGMGIEDLLRETEILPPNKRQALEEKLEELTSLQSVVGLEWYPDENQINELKHEIEAVSAAIQYDDNLREQEEIEI